MKSIFSLLLLSTSLIGHANSKALLTDTIPPKIKVAENKNEKFYCSDFAKTRYRLSITGTRIKITRLYKEFTDSYTGVIKNGKIYSSNPDEKNIKDLHGKYYRLEGRNFGVLNIENGDYEWFTECKQ
jgi:hypothetical protein